MQKMTRRHVMTTISSTAVLLCPAILNAQTNFEAEWAGLPEDRPTGENQLIAVSAGAAEVEISALQPGEVAVIARPTDDAEFSATGMMQYVAVHRRTAEQVAFGTANDRAGTVQNPEYFVVNLLCTHRGKAIGLTGNPDAPFACLDRGSRHGSVYNAVGMGVAGASEGEYLSIPDYTLTADGGQVVLSLA